MDPKNTSELPGSEPHSREQRSRALLTATLSTFDNSSSTPCLVTNISANGARLTISESVPIGEEFRLAIPQRNMFRTARQIWRKGDQLGLAFLPEAGSEASAGTHRKDAQIRALEAEVASLKAEVGMLRSRLFRHEEG